MNDSTTENINITKIKYPTASFITIILIIAKVWGDADISWLFCFAPILICLGVILILSIVYLIATYITYQ